MKVLVGVLAFLTSVVAHGQGYSNIPGSVPGSPPAISPAELSPDGNVLGGISTETTGFNVYVWEGPIIGWVCKSCGGGGGGATWGSITGVLSGQTDLQNALNAKQNTLETHTPYTHTVTAGEIAAKGFTLAYTPGVKERVLFFPQPGILQTYGTDYIVGAPNAANFLSWAGLGLDGVLIAGDGIQILYSN